MLGWYGFQQKKKKTNKDCFLYSKKILQLVFLFIIKTDRKEVHNRLKNHHWCKTQVRS